MPRDPLWATAPGFPDGTAGGRIVGYTFTAGITALFRRPYYYYHDVDAVLTGGDCETTASVNCLRRQRDEFLGVAGDGAETAGLPVFLGLLDALLAR